MKPSPAQRIAQIALLAIGLLGLGPTLSQPLTASIGYLVAGLIFAFTGWLLTERRADNGIGWCFLGMWAFVGLFGIADALQHRAVSTGDYHTWWAWLGGWLVGWMFAPLLILATTLPLLLFPSGLDGRFSRVIAWVAATATFVFVGAEMVSPVLGYFGSSTQKTAITVANNPLGISALASAGVADGWRVRNIALAVICATAVIAAVRLVVRGRRSSGAERLQFRWIMYGVSVMGILITLTAFPAFNDTGALGTLAWSVALAALPITMAVAILRFHLYDIDRVISRTLSYALVTGLLIAVYAGIVTSASRLLHTTSPLVVAAATLTAAAIARPALRRVQRAVDHRFDRARYDALDTLDHFGTRLRHEVDTDVVAADLQEVVGRALTPRTVTLWLREVP